jgi:hypothetical protein
MDKNFCPFFVFREKNLAKKYTIFTLEHYRAKNQKNYFKIPLQWFLPQNNILGHF